MLPHPDCYVDFTGGILYQSSRHGKFCFCQGCLDTRGIWGFLAQRSQQLLAAIVSSRQESSMPGSHHQPEIYLPCGLCTYARKTSVQLSLYSNTIYAISRNTWGTFVKFIFVVYKKTIGYYTVSIFSIRCDIIALSYLGKVEKHSLID